MQPKCLCAHTDVPRLCLLALIQEPDKGMVARSAADTAELVEGCRCATVAATVNV